MVSEHCTKMNKNEFEKEILENPERTRYDLVYFILNTFHLIVSNGYWYCYCNNENEKKIKLCTIPTIFFDFESDIDKNMFNISFLNFYHSRLCHELSQLMMKTKVPSSAFFTKNMNSGGETRHLGKPEVSVSETIRYSEKLKIAKLKAEKLPIPAEFLLVPDKPNF